MELFGEDWMEWCEANGGGNTAERLLGPPAENQPEDDAPEPAIAGASARAGANV